MTLPNGLGKREYDKFVETNDGSVGVRSNTKPVNPSSTQTTAVATNLVIKSSAGTLYEVRGYNSSASAVYLQIHDAASLPSNGAVPVEVYRVTTVNNFSIDFPQGRRFTNGIVICHSTTLATLTISGTAYIWFSADYE